MAYVGSSEAAAAPGRDRVARDDDDPFPKTRHLVFAFVAVALVSVAAIIVLNASGTVAARGARPPVDVLTATLFAAVSGAVAVASTLGMTAMRRRSQAAQREADRLEARIEFDLSQEKVFLLKDGQLTPASPATESYVRTAPGIDPDAPIRARLRARLGRETFRVLAPQLKALGESNAPFDFRATDATGADIRFRGEPLGAHAVVRFVPDPAPMESDAADAEEDRGASAEVVAGVTHAFDRAPLGVALFDADKKLLASNAAAARLWRLESDQLRPGATLRAIVDALRTVGRAPEVSESGDWRTQALQDPVTAFSDPPLWPLPDGDALRVSAQSTSDGGFLVYIADETDALGLERRFKILKGARQATIASIDQGLVLVGPDGRVQLLNPAFIKMWDLDPGLEQAAVDGNGPSLDGIAKSAVRTAEDGALWSRIRASFDAKIGSRRADGFTLPRDEHRVVAVRVTPLPDGAALIACDDVSDAYRVEAALRERNAALESADRVKTEFLAAVAAQLRTPLNSVIGFAELLNDGVAGELSQPQKEYVGNILAPAHDLRTLISDALDLGALESGSVELVDELVDLRKLVASVADMLSQRASMAGARILAEPPRGAVLVAGDENRLKQAAFGAGCAALALAEAGDALAMVLVSDGVEAVLRVSLIQRGSTASDREALDDGVPADGGVGMALSLTRRIVELHGGVVEIEETAGAKWIALRLPAAGRDAGPKPEAPTDQPTDPSPAP